MRSSVWRFSKPPWPSVSLPLALHLLQEGRVGQFELKLTSASTCTAWKGASFGTSLIVAVIWESEGIVARFEPRLMLVSRLNGGSFRSARAVVVNIELFAYQICGRCGFGAVRVGRTRRRVKINLQLPARGCQSSQLHLQKLCSISQQQYLRLIPATHI